ncbi:MAG: hypothetical protein G3M70_04565 [Candidatus Nitronauta litoralis]|uniref:Uncharacterized protein n=1 Tax=Candidatus Nitronauta litoralis TaxID=2705533 RepID=A0A7T0BUH7_9BACT|nr:MAG: hypothetical protein G3M70_04565 [Candidatus Nitronauta litoralis]
MSKESINISLTKDEGLVLFEMLSRFCDSESLSVTHESEKIALWRLLCLLEKQLAEPFKPNYDELLNDARENLLPGKD